MYHSGLGFAFLKHNSEWVGIEIRSKRRIFVGAFAATVANLNSNVVGDGIWVLDSTFQIATNLSGVSISVKTEIDTKSQARNKCDCSCWVWVPSSCESQCPIHGMEWSGNCKACESASGWGQFGGSEQLLVRVRCFIDKSVCDEKLREAGVWETVRKWWYVYDYIFRLRVACCGWHDCRDSCDSGTRRQRA
jgi:hypothetical protein